jgi:hypothetical protein
VTPFLFSLMLLRQRNDDRLTLEARKAQPNPLVLGALRQRRLAIANRVRRSLDRELLAEA